MIDKVERVSIRVEGKPHVVDATVAILRHTFNVVEVSPMYENLDHTVRRYVKVTLGSNVIEESTWIEDG